MHAALVQGIRNLNPQDGEHFAQRIHDRRARSLDEGAARLLALQKPRLDVEIPGALRTVRIDPFEIGLIGGEGEFAKLMRLVDDDLVDTDLLERHHVVAAASQRLEFFREFFLERLETLAGEAIVGIGVFLERHKRVELVLDHLPLESRRHRDKAERRMGDDDGIPGGRRRPREKARPFGLDEIGFVGNQNAGGRVELEKFARDLGQTMAGNDQHGLLDEAEPPLFHDRAGDGVGFSGAHGMRDIGRAAHHDAPDDALLVGIERDDLARAGKCEVASVEAARHEIVEPVIVDPHQAVGPIGIGPDPGAEGLFDAHEFFLGGLGGFGIENPLLDPVLEDGIEDLRRRAVERVMQQQTRMAA